MFVAHVLFCLLLLQLLDTAVGWVERERAQSQLSILMVVGLPNSGKSSLINALKMAARQAGRPSRELISQSRSLAKQVCSMVLFAMLRTTKIH
jgi:predicted GTPase